MGIQIRRLLLNLSLFALVAGLGGYVWWQQQQPSPQPETLLAFGKDAVQHVTVSRQLVDGSSERIQLQKQDAYWQMTEPKQAVVNPTRMTQLLTLLDEKVTASYETAGKDLKAYGLDPATVSLTFNDQTLVFGMDNPISHQRYVLHNGKLKLVSEAVYGLLTGEVANWLALQLVPPNQHLQRVTLPNGSDAKAEILANWQAADAMRVEAWDAQTAPATAESVMLHLGNATALKLVILSEKGDLVLGNAVLGVKYVVPETQRNGLLPM